MKGRNYKDMELKKNNNDIRCVVCHFETTTQKIKQASTTKCPNCGTEVPPMHIVHDITLNINWQELRILATYSKRWIAQFDLKKRGNRDMVQALENIIHLLSHYRPLRTLPIVDPNKEAINLPVVSPYFQKPGDDIDLNGMKF